MIDFAKLYCKAHPGEPINNFCADALCRAALCPTCICQHTEMHMQARSQPQFENIRATYSRVHGEIQRQIDTLSADKERLGGLLASIREKRENFRAVLQRGRSDCLQLVRDHFDELEKNWEAEIATQEKRHSLHNAYRLDTLAALINKQVGELIDESRRMNSLAFVEEIPRIEQEALVECRAFHERLCQELDDNERYTPIISYAPDNLKEVGESLKRLLTLEFSVPIKRYVASTNSQLLSRVSNASFRAETPRKEQPLQHSQSLLFKRPSLEKPQPQPQIALTQSALYSVPVPMVLTSSYLNSHPQSPKVAPEMEKSRTSKINFTPAYVDRVELNKFARNENRSQLKHKKSGLTLSNQAEADSSLSEKENARKWSERQ